MIAADGKPGQVSGSDGGIFPGIFQVFPNVIHKHKNAGSILP